MAVPLYALKVPEAVVTVGVNALVMMSDAGVRVSNTMKRIAIMGSLVGTLGLYMICYIKRRDKDNIMNKPESEFCYSFVVEGCSNPLAIQSSLTKTVCFFFLKMIYTSIRYPQSFMIITNRVDFSVAENRKLQM